MPLSPLHLRHTGMSVGLALLLMSCALTLDLGSDFAPIEDTSDIAPDVTPSCSNAAQDGDDEGIDCGGSCEHPCREAGECFEDTLICTSDSSCAALGLTCEAGCCNGTVLSCADTGITCDVTPTCEAISPSLTCNGRCCVFVEADHCGPDRIACRTDSACGDGHYCEDECCRTGGPGSTCVGAALDGGDLDTDGECTRLLMSYDQCVDGTVVRTECGVEAYCEPIVGQGPTCISDLFDICLDAGATVPSLCQGTNPGCIQTSMFGDTEFLCFENIQPCLGDDFSPYCVTTDDGDNSFVIGSCIGDQPQGYDCDLYSGTCESGACRVRAAAACDGVMIRCETGSCTGMVLGTDNQVLQWGHCP